MPFYFLFLVPHAFVFELLLLSSSLLFCQGHAKACSEEWKNPGHCCMFKHDSWNQSTCKESCTQSSQGQFFNCIIKKRFIGIVTKESTVYHHWFNNCYFRNFQRKFNLHWVRKFSFLPSGMCSAYMNNTYKLREIIQTAFAIHKI